jgi:sucrose-6-phosphate hydrolase SacC (GH32 family)
MRYRPPGMCLNDFALLSSADGWRVMHLQGPAVYPFDEATMETSYGLAQSSDLVTWQTLAPPFGIGEAGRFDDSAIWTMSHLPVGDGLAMFYTGVRRHPRAWQSIGLAMSDRTDGTAWHRIGSGPVAEVDERWYRADGQMAWRDPFVVADPGNPGSWAMAICARAADAPLDSSGCVGLATSEDLEHWTIRPPLLSPGITSELECPVLERVADQWLLLGCISECRAIDAWRSPGLEGPWEHLGQIGPGGAYAPRLVRGPEGLLVLHTQSQRFGNTDDGPLMRGSLSQPKLLSLGDPDRPHLRWWTGLEQFLSPGGSDRVLDGSAQFTFCDPERVVMRLGHTATALEVRLSQEAVSLGYADGTVLLTEALAAPPRRAARILRYREFVEVYVDDRFVLSHVAYAPREPEAAGWADERSTEVQCADLDPAGRQASGLSMVMVSPSGQADVGACSRA